mmetsp:Transcript_33708/g.75730  ORF Transcript_33708/g.75730 Transcript_33708/m.75730 type:complete len:254 (-) Transcript_33708:3481-4242(-)
MGVGQGKDVGLQGGGVEDETWREADLEVSLLRYRIVRDKRNVDRGDVSSKERREGDLRALQAVGSDDGSPHRLAPVDHSPISPRELDREVSRQAREVAIPQDFWQLDLHTARRLHESLLVLTAEHLPVLHKRLLPVREVAEDGCYGDSEVLVEGRSGEEVREGRGLGRQRRRVHYSFDHVKIASIVGSLQDKTRWLPEGIVEELVIDSGFEGVSASKHTAREAVLYVMLRTDIHQVVCRRKNRRSQYRHQAVL